MSTPPNSAPENDRYAKGLEILHRLEGAETPWSTKALQDFCPDLARFVVEFVYGDISSRPGLTDKQRQLTKLASIATLGYASAELKLHIHMSLNAGCTPQEIVEVIIQTAAYAGFPAALNGMLVAKEVLGDQASQAK